MQTFTHGAYRAKLTPTRNVGEFAAKLAKCNGKSRRLPLRDTRTKSEFPRFRPGMSTADYVRAFESGHLCAWQWEQLNEEPCALYSGEDTCETLPDGFDTWEDFDAAQSADAAPESTLAAANDDAAPTVPDPEPAAHGEDVAAPVPDLEAISAWSAAVNGAVRRGLDRTPIQHLPNYARMAIERADADSGLRSTAKVSELVRAYAATHGAIAEEWEIASALYICGRRFWDFDAAPDGAPVAAPVDPLPTQSDSVPVPGKLDAAQTARTAKILDRLIRSDGALMTRRAFVELKVADGLRPTCELQDKIKPMTRMQVFRATNEQQRAHDARVKAGGKREVFYLGGFEVTKAEHDYAAQIVAALQAPIADPVPSKSEPAADPFDAWQAAPNDPKPTFGAYSYAKRTGRTVIAYCGDGRIQSCAKAAGMRYVHRAKGFVGTPRQAEKMRAAWLAGAMRNAERAKDGVAEPGSLRAMLESLAVPTHAPLPGDTKPEALDDDETIPAPLDGLDVAELDGLAEFERAGGEVKPTAPAYRDDALCATPIPSLRIPAGDPRARIPARFARVYLLQA